MKKISLLLVFVLYLTIGISIISLYFIGTDVLRDWLSAFVLSRNVLITLSILWYGLSILIGGVFLIGFGNLLSRLLDGEKVINLTEGEEVCEETVSSNLNPVVDEDKRL